MTTPYVGQPGGAGPYPLVGLPAAAPPVEPLQLLASTGPAGFALQNATPVILSYTFPNDGNLHRLFIGGSMNVTSAETGGQVTYTCSPPAGGAVTGTVLFAAGSGVAPNLGSLGNRTLVVAGSGTTVTVQQATALTAGAAVVWVEIWGS
jgi:hypothetical protein